MTTTEAASGGGVIREYLPAVPVAQLRPHPENWREHPQRQRQALRALWEAVGIIEPVIARRLPDGAFEVLDGHMRHEETAGGTIGVVRVEMDDAAARKFLLLRDPVRALAGRDVEKATALGAGLATDAATVLRTLVARAGQERSVRLAVAERTRPAGPSPAEARATFEANPVKRLVIYVAAAEYDRTMAAWAVAMERAATTRLDEALEWLLTQ